MTRFSVLAASTLAVVGLSTGSGLQAAGIPKAVTAAVDDAARPQADKDRDAVRKPAETVAFAGIKPGQKVVELMPAGGYYTRILSVLVGPKGHVYAVSPPKRPDSNRDMGAAVQALAADPHYSNVTAISSAFTSISVPEPVDVVWTSDNYHDFHNGPTADIAAFNKEMLSLLKPGGTYLIVDHAAAAGAGTSATQKLHRIDPAQVKEEVTAAGFKFDKQGDFLHNPDDPHTAPIFDPSIRGKTDQLVMKFTKPK
jgi:predicted methyltransferase